MNKCESPLQDIEKVLDITLFRKTEGASIFVYTGQDIIPKSVTHVQIAGNIAEIPNYCFQRSFKLTTVDYSQAQNLCAIGKDMYLAFGYAQQIFLAPRSKWSEMALISLTAWDSMRWSGILHYILLESPSFDTAKNCEPYEPRHHRRRPTQQKRIRTAHPWSCGLLLLSVHGLAVSAYLSPKRSRRPAIITVRRKRK